MSSLELLWIMSAPFTALPPLALLKKCPSVLKTEEWEHCNKMYGSGSQHDMDLWSYYWILRLRPSVGQYMSHFESEFSEIGTCAFHTMIRNLFTVVQLGITYLSHIAVSTNRIRVHSELVALTYDLALKHLSFQRVAFRFGIFYLYQVCRLYGNSFISYSTLSVWLWALLWLVIFTLTSWLKMALMSYGICTEDHAEAVIWNEMPFGTGRDKPTLWSQGKLTMY